MSDASKNGADKARTTTIRDERVESWLTSRGAHFTRCIEMPLSQIDVRGSRNNQARPTAVVPEAVDRYAVAMRAGATFPPGVVYRPGQTGQFRIVDGINRDAAARKVGLSTFPFYVLTSDTDPALIELLTVEANARHGEPVPLAWRVHQALYLVSLGWKMEVACSAAGVTSKSVSYRQSLEKTDARVRELRIKGWANLPDTTRYALGQLPDDLVLKGAARIAIDTKATLVEVQEIVRSLKTLGSEAERLERIKVVYAERSSIAQAAAALGRDAHRIHSPKTNLTTAIGKLLAVDLDAFKRSILSDLEKKEIRFRLEQAAEKILELQIAAEDALKDE